MTVLRNEAKCHGPAIPKNEAKWNLAAAKGEGEERAFFAKRISLFALFATFVWQVCRFREPSHAPTKK
jgi:hypothetical protein